MLFLVRISHYGVKLTMHPKMIERNSRAIQIGTNMRKLSTIGSLVRIQLSQELTMHTRIFKGAPRPYTLG